MTMVLSARPLTSSALSSRPEHVVAIADHGVVGAAGAPDLLGRDRNLVAVVEREHAPLHRVAILRLALALGRRIDLRVLVEIPEPPRSLIGIVRMHDGEGQHERPAIGPVRRGVQPMHRLLARVLVILQRQRMIARSRLRHRVQRVEPGLHLVRMLPVRHPAEIRRRQVGGQALLIAVQLVGTGKIHLAGEAGAIARIAQMMQQRRHARRQLRRVVVGADAARQPARQHREARRRAQRRGAIGVLEDGPARRQPRHVRRLHHRMPVDRQRQGCHLIEHHEQDVGAWVLTGHEGLGEGGAVDHSPSSAFPSIAVLESPPPTWGRSGRGKPRFGGKQPSLASPTPTRPHVGGGGNNSPVNHHHAACCRSASCSRRSTRSSTACSAVAIEDFSLSSANSSYSIAVLWKSVTPR